MASSTSASPVAAATESRLRISAKVSTAPAPQITTPTSRMRSRSATKPVRAEDRPTRVARRQSRQGPTGPSAARRGERGPARPGGRHEMDHDAASREAKTVPRTAKCGVDCRRPARRAPLRQTHGRGRQGTSTRPATSPTIMREKRGEARACGQGARAKDASRSARKPR